jgi:arylsulfatase A-like enzyme/cytochrome c-type biogenesis protein CcmH/NrfG
MFPRNRAVWSVWLVVLLVCAGVDAQAPTPQETAQQRPPNLVLVTLDTVRADRIGCYGYAKAATPNLDRLAAEGIRFAQAYTPVPITLPSHATMFTGAYPMRTGMHDFSGNKLHPGQPTLASVLRARGYATAGITGAAVLDRRFGLNQGFDYYYDDFDFSRLDETNLDAMERPGSTVVDRGLAWLKEQESRPFFLFLHLYDAHHPYVPPEPYATQFRDRPYDGEIAYVDAQLGRVLAYLRQAKLYDNTMIIVAGDHGEGLGEHGEETHGFFIYNSTMRVPWVIKPVARTGQTQVIDSQVSLVDLMPTALDLLGVTTPAEAQGRSLTPLLRREEKTTATGGIYMESYLPRLHFNWSELRGIQAGRYKLIDAPKAELYDLERDPGETRNLLHERRATVRELRKRLGDVIARHAATGDTPTAEKTPLDPILSERLKSLGYVAVSGGSDAVLADRNSADPKDRIGMYELVSQAIADSQHGRYAQAVAQLRQALAIEPESTPVRHLLGLNYYRMRDWTAAAAEFEQVLQKQPDYSLATFYLGLAYGRAGQAEKAVARLRRALELDGSNFAAAFNLGAALLQLRRLPEAASAFRQAVTIYPEYAAGYEALGEVLLYQQQPDEAVAALRKAVELAPSNRKARLTLARALDARGLHAEAEEQRRLAGAGPPGEQR